MMKHGALRTVMQRLVFLVKVEEVCLFFLVMGSSEVVVRSLYTIDCQDFSPVPTPDSPVWPLSNHSCHKLQADKSLSYKELQVNDPVLLI